MINNFIIALFLLIIIIYSKILIASNSSYYLISQSAFNNHDYNTVLDKFILNEKLINNSKNLDYLLSAIITEDIILANKIALIILKNKNDNQEAKLVAITNYIINEKKLKIHNYRLDKNNNKNELFEFLFFNDNKLKNNNDIVKSFIEIVRSAYVNNNSDFSINYNYLLFYTSLAILIDPLDDEALFLKGQLFQIIEKYEEAQKIYSKIKEESIYYINAQQNIAFNYSKYLNYDNAQKKIQILIKKNTNDYNLNKILADYYRVNKKYYEAINIYNLLIEDSREDIWNIYYLRGICYERLEKWNIAEKDFLTSLKIKPNTPNVLNYLAYGWLERNINLEISLDMLKKAYENSPDTYYIIDSLAWAYYKKNNLIQAAQLMEKVIDIAPGEAISLDHLGDIYFAMNRKREAIHYWKQAKDLADLEDDIIENIEKKLINMNYGKNN